MTQVRRTLLLSGIALALIGASAAVRNYPVLLWNPSPSVPIGFYIVTPIDTLEVGSLVAVRPPRPLETWLVKTGRDPMDGMAARFSGRTRRTVVLALRLACLYDARLLLVVVLVRRLCAARLRRGGDHRRGRRHRLHPRRHLPFDPACPRGERHHHLRLGALGRYQRRGSGRPLETGRRGARTLRTELSASRRP